MFYRKLKDYILFEEGDEKHCASRTVIFGDLNSPDCEFHFPDANGNYHVFNGGGRIVTNELEGLYDYYVKSIFPCYRIEKNKIIPYLEIYLDWEE